MTILLVVRDLSCLPVLALALCLPAVRRDIDSLKVTQRALGLSCQDWESPMANSKDSEVRPPGRDSGTISYYLCALE